MEKQWLNWKQYYDNSGNSFWEAKAINSMFFRIEQKIMNDKIVYFESSDCELFLDPFPTRQIWSSVEDAKYDMDRYHQTLL